MKKLLELAREKADSVEVLAVKSRVMPVQFHDRRAESVAFKDSFNVSLRVLKDGRLGTSYATSLERRETLIEQAVKSATYGDSVDYGFSAAPIPTMDLANNDEGVTDLPLEKIAGDALSLVDHFQSEGVKSSIRAGITVMTNQVHFLNSNGVEGQARSSHVQTGCMLVLPESGVGPLATHSSHTYTPFPEEKKRAMIADYNNGLKRVSVPTRKMKLLITPHAWFMLKWRIERAASALSLVEHVTPLEGKEGEQVFDERVTIVDNPHRKGFHNTAVFDDEGVPTSVFTLFEKGVFKGFVCDLKHAKKLGRQPTGHGWKSTMWGGSIETPVQPALLHLMFEPGASPVNDMIAGMDEGVIVHFPNSAHSGNIPQGDFSVNIGLGYYVKDGRVKGRVEDCMVSGNIYNLFTNLDAISTELEDESVPYLLFKDVSIAGQA